MSTLRHPHVVQILDFNVTADGIAFLVMELLGGWPLTGRTAAGPALEPRAALHIVGQIADALAAAHSQPPRWRFVLPGVRAVDLEWGSASETVRLIAFKGGISIPMHDHGGPEYVVVFSRVLEEEGSSFKRGDISIREPGQRHEQHDARGETCVALVVSEGKLRRLTLRGRILLALAFE